MNIKKWFLSAVLSAATIFGAGSAVSAQGVNVGPQTGNPIKHVIVVIMENRSLNDLFNGYPGANTSTTAPLSTGGTVTLSQLPLMGESYDLSHDHAGPNNPPSPPWGGFASECGKLTPSGPCQANQFDQETILPGGCQVLTSGCPSATPFTYVGPTPNTQPVTSPLVGYWNIAKNYVLATNTFQMNQGPSLVAHYYLATGRAGAWPIYAVENTVVGSGQEPGCDNQGHIPVVDMTTIWPGNEAGSLALFTYNGDPVMVPHNHVDCFDMPTIFDLAAAKGLSWKYYSPNSSNATGAPGYWQLVHEIQHYCLPIVGGICTGPEMAHLITPSITIEDDITNNSLANISYVVPTENNSDHPTDGYPCSTAPCPSVQWVTNIVDAVGASPYWANTTIFIVWDDWGGFYDPVIPPVPSWDPTDPDEVGYRVPLLIVSPYLATPGTVDPTVRTQGSILSYIEDTFGLGNLNSAQQSECIHNSQMTCGPTMDVAPGLSDDMFTDFNFNLSVPNSFTVVQNNAENPNARAKILGILFDNEARGNGVPVGGPLTPDELRRHGNPDDDDEY